MSIREAVETFGIPQSTLGGKLRGKAHSRLQLREKTQCLQRLLKIGKKNFQTYMLFLFV